MYAWSLSRGDRLDRGRSDCTLRGLGGCITSQELEITAQPLPGKITVPDSQVAELLKTLPRAINFTDYFQRQTGGDCGLTLVNNSVGFRALDKSLLNDSLSPIEHITTYAFI
jgi:hypothetical protein